MDAASGALDSPEDERSIAWRGVRDPLTHRRGGHTCTATSVEGPDAREIRAIPAGESCALAAAASSGWTGTAVRRSASGELGQRRFRL